MATTYDRALAAAMARFLNQPPAEIADSQRVNVRAEAAEIAAALARTTALLVGTLAFAGVSAEAIAAIPEIKRAKELLG